MHGRHNERYQYQSYPAGVVPFIVQDGNPQVQFVPHGLGPSPQSAQHRSGQGHPSWSQSTDLTYFLGPQKVDKRRKSQRPKSSSSNDSDDFISHNEKGSQYERCRSGSPDGRQYRAHSYRSRSASPVEYGNTDSGRKSRHTSRKKRHERPHEGIDRHSGRSGSPREYRGSHSSRYKGGSRGSDSKKDRPVHKRRSRSPEYRHAGRSSGPTDIDNSLCRTTRVSAFDRLSKTSQYSKQSDSSEEERHVRHSRNSHSPYNEQKSKGYKRSRSSLSESSEESYKHCGRGRQAGIQSQALLIEDGTNVRPKVSGPLLLEDGKPVTASSGPTEGFDISVEMGRSGRSGRRVFKGGPVFSSRMAAGNTYTESISDDSLLDEGDVGLKNYEDFRVYASNVTPVSDTESLSSDSQVFVSTQQHVDRGPRTDYENMFFPLPCIHYNQKACYKPECKFLHICRHFLFDTCKFVTNCSKSHCFFDRQPYYVLTYFNKMYSPIPMTDSLHNLLKEKTVAHIQSGKVKKQQEKRVREIPMIKVRVSDELENVEVDPSFDARNYIMPEGDTKESDVAEKAVEEKTTEYLDNCETVSDDEIETDMGVNTSRKGKEKSDTNIEEKSKLNTSRKDKEMLDINIEDKGKLKRSRKEKGKSDIDIEAKRKFDASRRDNKTSGTCTNIENKGKLNTSRKNKEKSDTYIEGKSKTDDSGLADSKKTGDSHANVKSEEICVNLHEDDLESVSSEDSIKAVNVSINKPDDVQVQSLPPAVSIGMNDPLVFSKPLKTQNQSQPASQTWTNTMPSVPVLLPPIPLHLPPPTANNLPLFATQTAPTLLQEVVNSLPPYQYIPPPQPPQQPQPQQPHRETVSKQEEEKDQEVLKIIDTEIKTRLEDKDPELKEPIKDLWKFPHSSMLNMTVIHFVTETEAYKEEFIAELVKILLTIHLPYVTMKKLMSVIKEKVAINIQSIADLRKILDMYPENFQVLESADSDDDEDDLKIVKIRARVKLNFCEKHGFLPFAMKECNCNSLHMCKFYFFSSCSKDSCKFGHKLKTDHNVKVLRNSRLHRLTGEEIISYLRDEDNRTLETVPAICRFYNREKGCYKGDNIDSNDICHSLHLCFYYMKGKCTVHKCERSHSIQDVQPLTLLKKLGLNPDVLGDDTVRQKVTAKVIESEKARALKIVASKQKMTDTHQNRTSQDREKVAVKVKTEVKRSTEIEKKEYYNPRVPAICKFYNNVNGCKKKDWGDARFCFFLHICEDFISGECKQEENCKRSHDFFSGQPALLLKLYDIDLERITKVQILRMLNTTAGAPVQIPLATTIENPDDNDMSSNETGGASAELQTCVQMMDKDSKSKAGKVDSEAHGKDETRGNFEASDIESVIKHIMSQNKAE